MAIDLEFLLAECGVRQLHARYCDAVWRQDFGAFGNCFALDCEWRIDGVILRGREAIVEHNRRLFAKHFKRLYLTLRTPILEVGRGAERGNASGRTYFSGQNVMADGSGFAPLGVYHERFVDEGDQWRLKWRLFQSLYSGGADMAGKLHDQQDYGAPPAMPPSDAETLSATGLVASVLQP